MACRKDDIDKYTNDIGLLEEALSLASDVKSEQTVITTDLTNLQCKYSTTVKASDEFIKEFHELDKNAGSTASSLYTKIEAALEEAKRLLEEAEEEEKSCEIHNPSTTTTGG